MTNRFEKFSSAISEISRYWHQISTEEMSRYGLKGACTVYLTTLLKNPDGLTAAQLCEMCSKDKADVSRAICTMKDKGIIVNNNGYRALITLTEKGKKVAEQINTRAMLAVELAGCDISDNDRSVFYSSLEQITKNLQRISKQGLPK